MSIKQFSIDDVQLYREQEEDLDFSIVEIWALSEGSNSHNNPVNKSVLRKYSDTFKGKFIVAKFDKFKQDVTTHVADEIVIGYVDPNAEIEFKSKEVDGINKEFVVVKGLLSKIYAHDVVEMFRTHNERSVSCEFSCNLQYEENEFGEAIDEFGVVLNVPNPILSYSIHGITILGVSYNPSVKGAEIKVKQFMEKYNKPTLKELAQQRIEQINIKEFSQEDSLNINNIDNERKEFMEDKNLNLSESENKEEDIIMQEPNEVEKDEKEMSEDSKAENKEDKAEEEKEMGCGEKEMSEDSEIEEEDKDEDKEEEKKFSLDAYVDQSAMLAMLENETEENKELANSILKDFSADDIVKKFMEFAKENSELKAEMAKVNNEKREKKFSAIMASVKEDLEEKEFSELFKEGQELALEQLNAFENKVKAFAYEATKKNNTNKQEDEIMRFGASEEHNVDSADVFERLSKM